MRAVAAGAGPAAVQPFESAEIDALRAAGRARSVRARARGRWPARRTRRRRRPATTATAPGGRTRTRARAPASAASTSRPFDNVRWRRSSAARRPRQAVRRRSYSARGVEEVSGDRDVMIRRFGQLRNRDGLVGGVRHVNRSGTEQQRLAPARPETECRWCRETPRRRIPGRSSGGPAAPRARARSSRAARAAPPRAGRRRRR